MKQFKRTLYLLTTIFGLLFVVGCFKQTQTVTFLLGYDEQTYEVVEIDKNTRVTRPQDPEREGYTFLDWYQGDEPYNFNEVVKEDLVLKGKWNIRSYRVNFDVDGINRQLVNYKNKAIEPEEPTKEGYTFLGWYLNDVLYDFDSEVTSHISLTAKWEEITSNPTIKYTVTFNHGYDSLTTIKQVEEGSRVEELILADREGYNFLGWYLDNQLFGFDTIITSDITLYAKWEEVVVPVKRYNVTFDYGYDGIKTVRQINEGNKVEELTPSTREGYTFIGWYLNEQPFDFDTPIIENITLIAKWHELVQTYTVTFNSDGGNYTPDSITDIVSGSFIDAPETNPEKLYSFFLGWTYNNEIVNFPFKVTKNCVLTAKWMDIESNNINISSFMLLDEGERAVITGIITSFSLYEYISIEDETGATLVKITGYNTRDLENIGYKKGTEIAAYVTKTTIGYLTVAETSMDVVLKYSFTQPVPNSVNITGYTTLTNFKYRLIDHDGLVITNINDVGNKLIFTLETDGLTLSAIYDIRYYFANYELLRELKVNDIVELKSVILIYNGYYFVGIGSNLEINKVGTYTDPEEKLFKIFYLNDTHGAILNNGYELGLAKIGNYIKKESDQDSIFITGGDMFQGELLSNSSKGAVMIEIFNNIGLDAFVLGNHEFDWGLDVILSYFDPNTTGVKANFPLLAANVKRKVDNERPEFIDSHVIITRGSYRIGIIGVIGKGLESSIMRYRVEDYYFADPYTAVSDTINEIESLVDFVLVVNHDSDSSFNNAVSTLPKVRGIFNGHTHQVEQFYPNDIPCMQSGGNGQRVGRMELLINKNTGYSLVHSSITNLYNHEHLNSPDMEIEFIINTYYDSVRHLYEEEIIKANRNLSQSELAFFIAELMVSEAEGAVLGIQNSGGTRASIYQGSIMASDVFKVSPFDNRVVSVEITGADLKTLYNRETYTYLKIPYDSIDDYEYYRVATNDYFFYNNFNRSIFESVYDEVMIHADLYEAFYAYLVRLKDAGYTYFEPDAGIVASYNMPLYFYAERKETSLYLS